MCIPGIAIVAGIGATMTILEGTRRRSVLIGACATSFVLASVLTLHEVESFNLPYLNDSAMQKRKDRKSFLCLEMPTNVKSIVSGKAKTHEELKWEALGETQWPTELEEVKKYIKIFCSQGKEH